MQYKGDTRRELPVYIENAPKHCMQQNAAQHTQIRSLCDKLVDRACQPTLHQDFVSELWPPCFSLLVPSSCACGADVQMTHIRGGADACDPAW